MPIGGISRVWRCPGGSSSASAFPPPPRRSSGRCCSSSALLDPPPVPAQGADAFSWVFLVPALNEEVAIADSVQRLLSVPVARRRVVVIDDGSDDRTPEIIAGIDDPDLLTPTSLSCAATSRTPSRARRRPSTTPTSASASTRTVTARSSSSSTPTAVCTARPRPLPPVISLSRGWGMQSLVRIHNRGNLLTWLQDVEFSVYGHLFQAGRDHWGTAGMGGNASSTCSAPSTTSPTTTGLGATAVPPAHPLVAGQPAVDRAAPPGGAGAGRPGRPARADGLPADALLAGSDRPRARRGANPRDHWPGSVLGRRSDLAARLLLPACLRWDRPRLHRRPLRAGTAGLAQRLPDRPGLHPRHGFLLPVLLRSAARQLSSREGWAKTEREPLAGAVGDLAEPKRLSGASVAARS